MFLLTKPAHRRNCPSSRNERRPRRDDPAGEGEADEVTALIAETAATLAALARRHQLDMLDYLLRMAHLEAEEHLRLRSRRRLS